MMELPEYTIAELQERFANRELSALELCKAYIKRISEIDREGPQLRSIIEINPDVLEIAAELDKERDEKGPRGILHGIPILLKDSIDTADKMMTQAVLWH